MAGWSSPDREVIEWDGTIHARNGFVGDGSRLSGITVSASGAVSSVFTRQGDVVAVSGDYDHSQISSSGANTHAQIDNHIADTSDPHGSTLTQTDLISTGTASFAHVLRTGDFTTVSQAFIANIVLGTSATPPTASNFPQGTVYVQYTP